MTRIPRSYHNENRNITIEIAPRGSGKTRRLISAVIEYLQRDRRNKAYIFCINRDQVERLRWSVDDFDTRMSVPDFFERIRIHSYQSFGTMSGTRHPYSFINLSHLPNIHLFFDEFENMEDVPLVNNAYYSGSPAMLGTESNVYRFINEIGDVMSHNILGDAVRFSRSAQNQHMRHEIPMDDNHSLERISITTPSRRLDATWTMETATELRTLHGLNLNEELENMLRAEAIWGDREDPVREIEEPKNNDLDLWFYRLGVKI